MPPVASVEWEPMTRPPLVMATWVLVTAIAAGGRPAAPHRTMVNGADLAWVARGRGAPVVLVHGSGADLRTWGHQMDPLASGGFRAIAYSRRYHHPDAPPDAEAAMTVRAGDFDEGRRPGGDLGGGRRRGLVVCWL